MRFTWAHSNTQHSIPAAKNGTGSSKATRPVTSGSCCAKSSFCRSPSTRSRRGIQAPKSAEVLSSARRGISTADLSLFTRQLATLVRAGLPLEESLLAVSQQTEKPRVQSIVLGVRSKVMEGHTLADGLAEFPRVFPEIYRATVAAGEQSGKLDGILERLADYTESREQMRQKVMAAMLYPIVLTVMCFAIVSGLMMYVVPKVVAVFESTKGKLPLITQLLIASSDFIRDYGIYMAISAVVAGILFKRWLRNPANLRRWHRRSCGCPWSANCRAASTRPASRERSAFSRPARYRCWKRCASRAKS